MKKAAAQYKKGQDLNEKADFAGARDAFDEAYRMWPPNGEFAQQSANCLLSAGNMALQANDLSGAKARYDELLGLKSIDTTLRTKVHEKAVAVAEAMKKAAAEKAAAEKAAAEKAAAEKRTRDLFEAAKAGNNDELKRLIDLGGDVLWKNANDSGMTALHYAAFGGHLACVETLLLAKVRLVDNLTPDEATALHSAACGGHVNCIEALLRANVRLDATKTDGDTALHRAACLNKPDAVTRLLAAGAGTAIRNKAGRTALDVARKEGHISVIALLEAAEKANPISSIVDSARLRFGSLLEEMEAAMKAQKAAAEKAAAEKAAAEKAAAEMAAAEKAAAEKAAAVTEAADATEAAATQRELVAASDQDQYLFWPSYVRRGSAYIRSAAIAP
jgi:ankyrin repeat protein